MGVAFSLRERVFAKTYTDRFSQISTVKISRQKTTGLPFSASTIKIEISQFDGWIFRLGHLLIIEDIPLTLFLDMGDVVADEMRGSHVGNDGGQLVLAASVTIRAVRLLARRRAISPGGGSGRRVVNVVARIVRVTENPIHRLLQVVLADLGKEGARGVIYLVDN